MSYQAEAGKGSHKRKEDTNAIESNWDKIDWSKKVEKKEEDSGCSTVVEGQKELP